MSTNYDDLPIFCEGCPYSPPDGPYRVVTCERHADEYLNYRGTYE